jgi:two-component system response regulator AtoC
MQDSGATPPHHLRGAAMPKTGSTGSSGSLPVSMPPSLFPQIAESPAAGAQAPLPDGIERLDSHRVFVAVSQAMREVRRQIEQVAGIDGIVLLLGESGAGKEVVARMIHKLSRQASRQFLRIDCAAATAELLEGRLLGHETCASNGASQEGAGKNRADRPEICTKGAILLDEITALPLCSQARLLHLLQDGEFPRTGNGSLIQSGVRIFAATNADVRQAMQNGALRSDLYYRLNAFTIYVPPLRDRREDLPHLLNHFMNAWATAYGRPRLPITRRILEICAGYCWPGNVRELENFVKRYLVMGSENLALRQLDDRRPKPEAGSAQINNSPPLSQAAKSCGCDLKSMVRGLKEEAERAAIVQALEQTGGNKQEAAILLRISLRALHYKVRAYAIDSIAREQQRSFARENSGMRSVPAVAAYPLLRAANGGLPLAASGNGKSADRGNGKPISSGKLIGMDRASARLSGNSPT